MFNHLFISVTLEVKKEEVMEVEKTAKKEEELMEVEKSAKKEEVSSVLYCFGVEQPFFETMQIPNLTFHEGLPDKETIKSMYDGKFHIVIIDDLMEEVIKSDESQNLFTKYCHHYNISVIFLTQNIFAKGKCARSININTHILILFRNKRDESQADHLGRQVYKGKGRSKGFWEVYDDATNCNYGYLVIDCSPDTAQELKFRTNIFPNEHTIVYIPH